MVFSTLTFCIFFLIIVFILYYLIPDKTWKNTVLLVFSLIFYSWGQQSLVLLLIAVSLVAYFGGLLIDRFEKNEKRFAKRTVFIISIVFIVGNLFVFKYLNFFTENISNLFGINNIVPVITLPIGISFYTFQILSYVIDLYKKKIDLQKNYFYLLLYICFFPQLIAGPIVRYQTVEHEIINRNENIDEITEGIRRFSVGLAKKVVLANNISVIAEIIYNCDKNIFGTGAYWLAAISFSLNIYFDFSGYSDMAIGLGKMFGFHFLENFNFPYISKSITEFWRRWHISLGTWFRDYVYIPLGGNRKGKLRWLINIVIVWGLTGFWHGAKWNFLVWGCYYAVLLIFEKLFILKLLKKIPAFFQWMYTSVLVIIGWVIFNLTDFGKMMHALKTMFVFSGTNILNAIAYDDTLITAVLYIPLGIFFAFPFAKRILDKIKNPIILNIITACLFFISVIYMISSSYNPFIYFRF